MSIFSKKDLYVLKGLLKKINGLSTKSKCISSEINNYNFAIKSLQRQREKLLLKKKDTRYELMIFQDEFKVIEGNETCYGCLDRCRCLKYKNELSPRCDDYNDLPF